MEKISGFFKKCWSKRNDTVNSLVGWCVYGGVLAVSIALALIIWL